MTFVERTMGDAMQLIEDAKNNGTDRVLFVYDTAWNSTTQISDFYDDAKGLVFHDENSTVTGPLDEIIEKLPRRPNCTSPFMTTIDPGDTPPIWAEYNSPCYEAFWDGVGFDPIMIVWIVIIDIIHS